MISSLTLFLFKNILFNVHIFLDFSVVYYWFLVSFHFVCRRKLKYSCGLTCHPFWRVFLFLVHLRRMYILLLLNGGNLFPPVFTYIFTSCCSLFFCIDLCFLLTSVSCSHQFPLTIYCWESQLIINFLTFFCLKIFISYLLRDISSKYRVVFWLLFSFISLKSHCLLACLLSDKKTIVILVFILI